MVLRALLIGILNADSSREGVLTCPDPCRARPGEAWLGAGLGSGLPIDASVAAYNCRRVACTCHHMLLHGENFCQPLEELKSTLVRHPAVRSCTSISMRYVSIITFPHITGATWLGVKALLP